MTRTHSDAPLISVLMGVYYRKPDTTLLERSVRSILEQTVREFELLVCDGGSSPEACRFLEEMSALDSRVRLVREEGLPTGLAHKLNACLRRAGGSLIARMDDDDLSHPERFERQVECLQAHPEYGFVGCNVNLVRQGEACGSRSLPACPAVKDFYFVQPFIHPALMFRREALAAVGGYSEGKYQVLCEDYDLLLRLYSAGYRGANIQDSLLDYTIPDTAKGSRRMRHRWNEAVTRWRRFRELGVLPGAFPYVLKPLAVGLLPERVLNMLKGSQH